MPLDAVLEDSIVARPEAGQQGARHRVDQLATRDWLGRRLLALSDVLAAALSLLLCISVFGDDHLRAATLLGVPLSKIIGLYDRDDVLVHKTTLDETPAIFHLATLYTLAMWLLSPVVIVGTLGRGQAIILWLAFMVTALAGRYLVRRFVERISPPERCLLVGDVRAAAQLAGTIERDELKAQIVGRMDTKTWAEPYSYRSLSDLVERHGIHRIIVAPDDAHPERMADLVRAAKGLDVRVSILPRVLEVVGSNVEFDNLGGVPLLGVHPLKLSRSSLLLKRTLDLVGASLGLLFAAPLLIAVAVAVKLDSRGPVFFRQTRVGRDGRRFGMTKFRSMVVGADAMKADLVELNEAEQGLFKIAEDPRITRVGRFLRRTSLDELPQLFNVLRGDMSLVGPRPLVVAEDALITGFDRRRLELTPGMTGHWQILGSSRVPLGEMVKIDYLYVAGWSLWSDVKLLLRTVPYVLSRRGQ